MELTFFCGNLRYIIAEDKETADNISESKSQGEEEQHNNFDFHNHNNIYNSQANKLRDDGEFQRGKLRKSSSNYNFQAGSPQYANINTQAPLFRGNKPISLIIAWVINILFYQVANLKFWFEFMNISSILLDDFDENRDDADSDIA